MFRAYASLGTRLMLLPLLAVLACAAPALADVTWTFSGVTLLGANEETGSVNGDFTCTYDTATSTLTMTSWDIQVTAAPNPAIPGIVSPFTFTSGNSTWTSGDLGPPYGTGLFNTGAGTPDYQLFLAFSGDLADLGVPGTSPLTLLTSVADYYVVGTNEDTESFLVTGGELVSAVPLPPSAALLGFGLIPLAWLRRKKRLGK